MSVRFACHGAFVRVVIPPPDRTVVVRCPSCGKELRLKNSPEGSNLRHFEVAP